MSVIRILLCELAANLLGDLRDLADVFLRRKVLPLGAQEDIGRELDSENVSGSKALVTIDEAWSKTRFAVTSGTSAPPCDRAGFAQAGNTAGRARIRVKILNRMTSLGMPHGYVLS